MKTPKRVPQTLAFRKVKIATIGVNFNNTFFFVVQPKLHQPI
jgi:hypothetical protein